MCFSFKILNLRSGAVKTCARPGYAETSVDNWWRTFRMKVSVSKRLSPITQYMAHIPEEKRYFALGS